MTFMNHRIGDIRMDEFIYPDNVTVWEVRQLVVSKGRYAKPGATHWARITPGPEPFTDKAEAIRFVDSLNDISIIDRFLRGGFKSAAFPGGQLLTKDEHEVICDHIKDIVQQLEAEHKRLSWYLDYIRQVLRDGVKGEGE